MIWKVWLLKKGFRFEPETREGICLCTLIQLFDTENEKSTLSQLNGTKNLHFYLKDEHFDMSLMGIREEVSICELTIFFELLRMQTLCF